MSSKVLLLNRLVQSYFDFRPYWSTPPGTRGWHVFDTINAKYVLTATEGGPRFRGMFCVALVALRKGTGERYFLINRTRASSFPVRVPRLFRAGEVRTLPFPSLFAERQTGVHDEPAIFRREAMILAITASHDTGEL